MSFLKQETNQTGVKLEVVASMTTHILLIENSKLDQSESLAQSLEAYGHQTYLVHPPQTTAKKIETLWPNLVIFNPLSRLELSSFPEAIDKTDLNIPYIVIGHKNDLPAEVSDRAIVVSPDNIQQLDHDIERAISKQKDRFIRLPNLILDCQQSQVLRNKKRFSLTPKEFRLLYLLITNLDQVLSRKTIMQEVWETDYMGDTRTLDVHIRWLREKVEENPSQPQHLITARGVGYRFITEELE